MMINHMRKWIFGVLIVALVCMVFSQAVAAETVTKELYVEDSDLYGEFEPIVLQAVNINTANAATRLTLQEELGAMLYFADPTVHQAIILQYRSLYPELRTPQADGNTYVYIYGDRLTVTFNPDGSLLTTTKKVEGLPNFIGKQYSRAATAQSTGIYTATITDYGLFMIPHTILELKGWFEYDGSSYPIPHLISFGTTKFPDDRQIIYSATRMVDMPAYSEKIVGEFKSAYISSGDGICHYILEIVCDVNGNVHTNSQKL